MPSYGKSRYVSVTHCANQSRERANFRRFEKLAGSRRAFRFLLAVFALTNLRTQRLQQNRFAYVHWTFTHRFASKKERFFPAEGEI